MFKTISKHRMKSGQTAEIGVIEAPDPAETERVAQLYCHKSLHWRRQLELALLDKCDLLESRIYGALLEGVIVASACCFERHGAGILSHVHTHEVHRRQGLCSAVLGALFEGFKERGGWSMVLGTTFESPAYWIYHAFGFRSLRGGFMQWMVPGTEEIASGWFDGTDARVVEARWEHWPLVCHLAATPAPLDVRHVGWQLPDVGLLEREYLQTLLDVGEAKATARILETPSGAVVGAATRAPHAYWHDVALVDVLYHPDYAEHVPDLLAALDLGNSRCLAYADVRDMPKREALGRAGFKQVGQLPGLALEECRPAEVALYHHDPRT